MKESYVMMAGQYVVRCVCGCTTMTLCGGHKVYNQRLHCNGCGRVRHRPTTHRKNAFYGTRWTP